MGKRFGVRRGITIRYRQYEVVDVHFGHDDACPTGLQCVNEVKHENPECGSGEPRDCRDASDGGDGSGAHTINTKEASL